jgi:hypothetical protein
MAQYKNCHQNGEEKTNDPAHGNRRFPFSAILSFDFPPPAAISATISPLVEKF